MQLVKNGIAIQALDFQEVCVVVCCVCAFFPFILDIKSVGRTSRGHTGGRSHRNSHPLSFCGACLNFSLEKDSAIPFPRRPWSRILCTNDLIAIHLLGLLFYSEKNPLYRNRTHVPTCQKVTRLPLLPGRPGQQKRKATISSVWAKSN